MASYGSRGDIEPCAALARELQRRGHDVQTAVPPDLIPLVESVGLTAVPYGVDSRAPLEAQRNLFRSAYSVKTVREAVRSWREASNYLSQVWTEASKALLGSAEGADLIFTGLFFEEIAANIAEYYDIPLTTMHYTPVRPNGHIALRKSLPSPVFRSAMHAYDWLSSFHTRKLAAAQRCSLGLPPTKRHLPQRIADRGWLELQAYDEAVFPGLAAEWQRNHGDRRPFVGGMTLELPAPVDDEVASWIASGDPPIYFGFGSVPIGSPNDTFTMIRDACAQLGERALICSGGSSFGDFSSTDRVKVVSAVNHATAFPACRAVVHGGTGATTAGLRAGVPALVLWTLTGQRIWGAQVETLKVGASRRLATITRELLVDDLRRILAPDYVHHARDFARTMTKPADSVSRAADYVECVLAERS